MDLSTATTDVAAQVSITSVPNSTGDSFNDASLLGGISTDATVTVTLVDSGSYPIYLYPFEDIWLEASSGNFAFCPGGTVADASTDVNGQTTFSYSMLAGGSGTGLVVHISGRTLSQDPLDFIFNSPDFNGDLAVNLIDAVLFANVYFGSYNVSADFYWDGEINLSDVSIMGYGMRAVCP